MATFTLIFRSVYIAVGWPEIQEFMEHKDYPTKVGFDPDKNTWFVPKEMYNEVLFGNLTNK